MNGNEWMDRWMDGRKDGYMDGWIDERTNERTNERTWIDNCINCERTESLGEQLNETSTFGCAKK